jgi:hypothetical protein
MLNFLTVLELDADEDMFLASPRLLIAYEKPQQKGPIRYTLARMRIEPW